MIDILLRIDHDALLWASNMVDPHWAFLIRIFAEAIVVWVALFLILLWLRGVQLRDNTPKIIALHIAILVIFVFVIYILINSGIPQWRESPGDIVNSMKAIIPHPADNSFPSGHGLFTGAFIIGLYQYYPRKWLILASFLIGVITTVSRVFGGVHYFGDIIAGFVVGIVGALILAPLADRITSWIAPYCLRIARWFHL